MPASPDAGAPPICVSVGEPTAAACIRLAGGEPFIEFRLDKIADAREQLSALFGRRGGRRRALDRGRVATCRPGALAEPERRSLLLAALRAGADHVDVELEASPGHRRALIAEARRLRRGVIVSFHDLRETPPQPRLASILRRALALKPDVVKIACAVRTPGDVARLLGLLQPEGRVVVVGLGAQGVAVRILAPLLGAPFTFAAASGGAPTAPGQPEVGPLRRAQVSAARLLGLSTR